MRTHAGSAVLGGTINPNGSPVCAGSQRASPVPTLTLIDSFSVSPMFKGQELVSQYVAGPGTLNPPQWIPSYSSVPSQPPKLSLLLLNHSSHWLPCHRGGLPSHLFSPPPLSPSGTH